MKHIDWAKMIEQERRFIKKEMKRFDLTPRQLAGLANLGTPTVCNFIHGNTFSPAHRTVTSMFEALGYEILQVPKSRKRKKRGA